MGEVLYLGRGNTIDRQLKAEDDDGNLVAQDLSAGDLNVTQIDAIFYGDDTTITISSMDKTSGAIKWDQVGYATGEIRIDPSAAQETALSDGFYNLVLVVYNASWTDGIVWDEFGVHVKTV